MEQTLTPVFRVSELNEYVGLLFSADPNLSEVRVTGEISGLKRHTSGHLYFTLKDETASVRCVMFRQQAIRLNFAPQDGMQVLLYGRASIYEKDGSFQLYANYLKKSGEGELYLRFLALKKELEEKGWFDPGRKRQIPFLPARVGVVTSETGAALQDIIQIIRRRFPRMPIVVAGARVQGQGAAKEIAAAIRRMNEANAADVLIVGRGGGSIEDLWAFNEPVVAEAIVNSDIPVISAVGHETDFTIADFAADLRAPTPSAAAELAVPEADACYALLTQSAADMRRALEQKTTRLRANVLLFRQSGAFRLMERRVQDERLTLDALRERAARAAKERGNRAKETLLQARATMLALNPRAVLERGYAIVTDENGETLNGLERVNAGDRLRLSMHDGTADVSVERVEPRRGGQTA